VKGGAAYMHGNLDAAFPFSRVLFPSGSIQVFATGVEPRANFEKWGWTVGTGFEYRLSRSVSAFVEYNYMDFGTKALALDPSTQLDLQQQVHAAKLGLNIRF